MPGAPDPSYVAARAALLDAVEAMEALDGFSELFGTPNSTGCRMAARALAPMEPEATTAASVAALAQDLIGSVGSD